jgi:hypothetical protein
MNILQVLSLTCFLVPALLILLGLLIQFIDSLMEDLNDDF